MGPHFTIPNLGFNFYAFFLVSAVFIGEIYLFSRLKSVPKLGRIFFAVTSIAITLGCILAAILLLPHFISSSLCGAAAFILTAFFFDQAYNNPKIYKLLDIKQPVKIPKYYFTKNCLLVAPLIYAIAKLRCTYAGCCHGFSYSGPFSLSYNNKEAVGEFFPIQPLETIVFAAIFIFAHKTQKPIATIILCALAKFFLDFLRDGHDEMFISFNQIAGLIILVAISITYFARKNILLHK